MRQLLLIMLLLVSTAAFSQRTNSRGEKLVSKVDVVGSRYTTTYHYYYDDNGDLYRMFVGDSKEYVDVFKSGKKLICKIMHNGVDSRKSYYGVGDWFELEVDEHFNITKSIWYSNSLDGSQSKEEWQMWYDTTPYDGTYYVCESTSSVYQSGDKRGDFVLDGCKKTKYEYNEDGDLSSRYTLQEYDTNARRYKNTFGKWYGDEQIIEYSDIINDTSVNLDVFYFDRIGYTKPIIGTFIESTEWCRQRSKHLFMKSQYSNPYTFEFDDNGNLITIRHFRNDGYDKIINITYLY